jgi:hypothetical protein
MGDGEAWTRMAVILICVALFTAGSSLLFVFSKTLKERYGLMKAVPAEPEPETQE